MTQGYMLYIGAMATTLYLSKQQQNLGRRIGASKIMHLSPQWFRLLSVLRMCFYCWSFIVFSVAPSVCWGFCVWSFFCYAVLSALSSFLIMVVWLFLVVPWVCLRFGIMIFPDHIYLYESS